MCLHSFQQWNYIQDLKGLASIKKALQVKAGLSTGEILNWDPWDRQRVKQEGLRTWMLKYTDSETLNLIS